MKKSSLNPNQLKAVQHSSGPLLVVAGAGTGKTRVITERIKYLIEQKQVSPKEILALTFTEKAAAEMLERVGDVMPLGYEEPWVCTFHAFADRILSTTGLEIGLDPSYRILSTADQWILLRKHLFKLPLDYFRPLGNPTKFIAAILKLISRLQDEDIHPTDLQKFVEEHAFEEELEKKRWQELAMVYQKYQEIKLAESKLDFGDLITLLIKLYQTRPNILHQHQKQFKHILVDEFQDTNFAQYELIKILFPTTDKSEKEQTDMERSLLVVGDDSQSIYKFRGAAVSNILQFMGDYPVAEMCSLTQNYRSSQAILDTSYSVIQNNNPDTLEAKLGISKKLSAEAVETEVKPEILQFDTVETEAQFVGLRIEELLGLDPNISYKDIAILARANSHLEPFIMELRKRKLPYQVVGNRGLYDRDEIRNILSLLKVVINPHESTNLIRALSIDCLAVPQNELTKVISYSRSRTESLWDTVSNSQNTEVQKFLATLDKYRLKITSVLPSQFVYELIHEIGYLGTYTKEESVENTLCLENLNLLLNKLKVFENNFSAENSILPNIIDFMDYLDMSMEAGEDPGQAQVEDYDTINLMTIHASKGLEFKAVFMVNLVSDRIPSRNRRDVIQIPDELVKEALPSGDEHIQEERRLFYVAMTRAREYLFMILARDYGGKREKHPSGFLAETGLKTNIVDTLAAQRSQQTLFGLSSGYRELATRKMESYQPNVVSYSQLDTYETCPLQYKFRYVLKVPTQPNHSLSFGNSIHNTLREYHMKKAMGSNISLDELNTIFAKNWENLGYIDEDHRKHRFESGKELLRRYYERHNAENIKHMALEKNTNFYLDGTKFFGRIDRLDYLPDGGIEIIDYKTGTAKSQKEIDKDKQVAVYALALKETMGVMPEKLSYYYLETGEKLSTERTEEQLAETRADLIEDIKEIKKAKFDATPGMHCDWCDFREICPFARRS